MENMYKSCSDIKASARAFLAKSEEFTEILYTEEPFVLGFLCIHDRKICEKVNVMEAYFNATFKTSSSKLELFWGARQLPKERLSCGLFTFGMFWEA